MKKISLSPTLFLVSEFFMIIPSILFILGIIKYDFIQNIFIAIVLPATGGFVAYNYLERYRVKGFIKTITKAIIGYSILEIGLVLFFSLTM